MKNLNKKQAAKLYLEIISLVQLVDDDDGLCDCIDYTISKTLELEYPDYQVGVSVAFYNSIYVVKISLKDTPDSNWVLLPTISTKIASFGKVVDANKKEIKRFIGWFCNS